MPERYFTRFEFREFKPPEPLELVSVPVEMIDIPTDSIETITFEEFICYSPDVDVKSEPQVWTQNELYKEFVTQLRQMDKQIGYPRLTMHRRIIEFVIREEMRPQTEEDSESLIKRYGNYIADGGAGDCTCNPEGTFTMRIGFAGQEDTTLKDDVLAVMAHEYGHTLGHYLDHPVLEELKAYSFANLFMRYYCDVEKYRVFPIAVSTVHDTAQYWLEQLLEKGVNEEAILAHLTGRKFGKSYPNDYISHLQD